MRPASTVGFGWTAVALAALAVPGCGDVERGAQRASYREPVARLEPASIREAPTSQTVALRPEYRLRLDPSAHTVAVRLEIDVPRADSVYLRFRVDWGGYPGLAERVRRLQAFAASGGLSVAPVTGEAGSGHHVIAVDRPGRVTIIYEARLTPPADSRLYHRASQLAEEGGHLLTGDLLPFVSLGSPDGGWRQGATIWFSGLPSNWRVNSVERRSGTGYDVEDTQGAVFVVGPSRTRRAHMGPRSVTVAIQGRWPVPDERLFDAVERLAGSLHRIAGDGWPSGDHLIGVGRAPVAVQGLTTGGQVLGPAGLIYLGGDPQPEAAMAAWLRTASHELMHWYIPTGFRFADASPSWFAEGFTDYMSLKALLAGGLIEPQAFLDEIGQRLQRYRANPLYGQLSLPEAQTDFWEDDAYRFIYDGGASAAFLLDLGFQDRGGSLERVLRQLQRVAPLTTDTIQTALAGIPENEWIVEWLRRGANPDWDARLSKYRLNWSGRRLVSQDDWATNALASIRP